MNSLPKAYDLVDVLVVTKFNSEQLSLEFEPNFN